MSPRQGSVALPICCFAGIHGCILRSKSHAQKANASGGLRALEVRLPRSPLPLLVVLLDSLLGVGSILAPGHELAKGGDVLAEVSGGFAGDFLGAAEDRGAGQA